MKSVEKKDINDMILSGKSSAEIEGHYTLLTPTKDYKHKPFSILGNEHKNIRRKKWIAKERSNKLPKCSESGLSHLGIIIDKTRDKDLSEQAYKLLKDYYCNEDENSPQEAYARASVAYCGGDLELAQRVYNYVSKGWFMFASPVLSNAPKDENKANITNLLFFDLCTRFT